MGAQKSISRTSMPDCPVLLKVIDIRRISSPGQLERRQSRTESMP
jgi:hypothetical protein